MVYQTEQATRALIEQTGKLPTNLEMKQVAEQLIDSGEGETTTDVFGVTLDPSWNVGDAIDTNNIVDASSTFDENPGLYIDAEYDMQLTVPTTAGRETVAITQAARKKTYTDMLKGLGRVPTGLEFFTALTLRHSDVFGPTPRPEEVQQ